MERYIAIDNVCAWPILTRMPDGRIIATIHNKPSHGKMEGDVECWESADEGRFWKRCGVPAPHEPGTVRMNVGVGLARNGDLVALASGWGGEDFRRCILPCWVCRSADGGRTWRHDEGFPSVSPEISIIPYGKIIPLPDGTLGASGYCFDLANPRKNNSAWLLRSRDDGRAWGEHVLIAEGHSETDILEVEPGRVLAVSRSQGEQHLDLYVSEDGGKSWRWDRQLTGAGQIPGSLLKLSDGRVLMCHGMRSRGFHGIGARFSEDGGRNWSGALTLAEFDGAADSGYPSSLQSPDGTIVTAYYAGGITVHQRYHMGVLRWRLDEQLKQNARG